jgi:hypothetical protein
MRRTLEIKIIGKINAIKNGTVTPKESGIGSLLNRMKTVDEPLYDDLLGKYKKALKDLEK